MDKIQVLFLDDLRPIPEMYTSHPEHYNVTVVRSYDEFCAIIDANDKIYHEMSFDHDLGDGKTGYDCITYLEYKIRTSDYPIPNTMLCHSANPSGSQRIRQVIECINTWGGK